MTIISKYSVKGVPCPGQYHMTVWHSIPRIRSLNANILGSSDSIALFLGLFGSPCSGLYRRKKSARIGSLGPEILTFKDWVRSMPIGSHMFGIFCVHSLGYIWVIICGP